MPLHALMALFVLLVGPPATKEELRYATEISGVQCVVMAGVTLMHKLYVDSLDLQQQVYYMKMQSDESQFNIYLQVLKLTLMLTMVKDMVKYSWTM